MTHAAAGTAETNRPSSAADSPLSVFRNRERTHTLIVLAFLLGAAGVAWVVTGLAASAMNSRMMAMMVMSGPGGISVFLAVWAVMMVAMMFPAAAPMVQAYVTMSAKRMGSSRRFGLDTAAFLASYVFVWTLFGAGIAGLYLPSAGAVQDLMMGGTLGPALGGAILVLAGVYQLTPLKTLCLNHCRSPLQLLMTRFRPGARGALSLGARHAAYCVGCCWALFAVLFAVGVMSIPWMGLLSVLVTVEKWAPRTSRVSYAFGVLLLVLGGVFIAVPGLWMSSAMTILVGRIWLP